MDDPSTYYTPLRMSRPFAAGITVGGPSVAIDGTPAGALTRGAVNVASQAITVGSNANRALVLMVANGSSLSVSGVAYTSGSGGAWSLLGTFLSGAEELEIWSSVAPSVGAVVAQATFSGNIGAGSDANLVLYSLFNVDQTTPLDGYANNGSTSNSVSTTLSSGGLVIAQLVNNVAQGAITAGTEDYADAFNFIFRAGHNSASGTLTWAGAIPDMDICNVRKA